jgi:hypothetical protein
VLVSGKGMQNDGECPTLQVMGTRCDIMSARFAEHDERRGVQ